jgi:hypothetical protein
MLVRRSCIKELLLNLGASCCSLFEWNASSGLGAPYSDPI